MVRVSVGIPRTVATIALSALVAATPATAKGKRPAKRKVHRVREGEILGVIAARHGCTVDQLRRANRLNGDLIRAGTELVVPRCKGKKQPYAGEGRPRVVKHTIIPGETLGSIAVRYGTSVDDLRRRNRLHGSRIRAGRVLKVRANVAVRERREFVYRVQRGDTLARIASRYEMSWQAIKRMNPGVDPRRLRIGQRLRLWRDGPAIRSATEGRPQEGRLVHGEQLPPGPGYYRRRPNYAWGTNETIARLLEVIARVRKKHPKVHDLAIGDISRKEGGPLPGHVSHQSGRDVDIGLFFAKHPKVRPRGFLSATTRAVDFPATWTLLTALAGRSKKTGHVEYIFLDRGVQKRLYEWALRKGTPKKLLGYMFQYPGGTKAGGVIRHEPNHGDHLHVRFECPANSPRCR